MTMTTSTAAYGGGCDGEDEPDADDGGHTCKSQTVGSDRFWLVYRRSVLVALHVLLGLDMHERLGNVLSTKLLP